MIYEIRMTPEAKSDLRGIFEYIAFDLHRPFSSVHVFAPFHSEGLGHFLCLLRMFLSFRLLSPTTEKKLFCQTSAKEKRRNLKKDYNAF